MEYWKPKNQSGMVGGYGLTQASSVAIPKPELPEVGAKLLLLSLPYGISVIGDGAQIPTGADVIEVEVTALKKATVTLE